MFKKVSTVLIILVSLFIAYKLIFQISDALKSGERLSTAADQVFMFEAKNKQLKKKLSEVESPQFIEEEARNKLGLGKPGETVVIIPENKLRQVLEGSSSAEEVRLPNYQGWLKVFFH